MNNNEMAQSSLYLCIYNIYICIFLYINNINTLGNIDTMNVQFQNHKKIVLAMF